MSRQAKDYTNLTCRLASDAAAKLEEMSEQTDRTKTVIVEHAIRAYYDSHFLNNSSKD